MCTQTRSPVQFEFILPLFNNISSDTLGRFLRRWISSLQEISLQMVTEYRNKGRNESYLVRNSISRFKLRMVQENTHSLDRATNTINWQGNKCCQLYDKLKHSVALFSPRFGPSKTHALCFYSIHNIGWNYLKFSIKRKWLNNNNTIISAIMLRNTHNTSNLFVCLPSRC